MLTVHQTFATEAQHLLDKGEAKEAAQQLEQGLRHYPDYTTAYVVLARAYQTLNDNESAHEVVQRALKRFPTHRVLRAIEAELQPMLLRKTAEPLSESDSLLPGMSKNETNADSIVNSTPNASTPIENESTVSRSRDVGSEPHGGGRDRTNPNQQSSAEAEETVQELSATAARLADEPKVKPEPEPNDTDTLLDDGLSNIDDDNDNWPELREIVEDDSRVDTDEQPAESEQSSSETTSTASEQRADAATPQATVVNAEALIEGTEESARDDAGDSEDVDTNSVLKRINVVRGSVVVDQSLLKRLRVRLHESQLRFIDTTSGSGEKAAHRSLRASNMRLVPGLEFTPLRVQSMRKHVPRSYSLGEPPAFPVIRGSEMNISPAIAPSPEKEQRKRKGDGERRIKAEVKRTQLEELAARLERARIPVVTEEPEPGFPRFAASDASEPMVISETMAGIYEQQGLYEQAIKAYRQLARIKPEKLEYFEQKIAQLAKKPE